MPGFTAFLSGFKSKLFRLVVSVVYVSTPSIGMAQYCESGGDVIFQEVCNYAINGALIYSEEACGVCGIETFQTSAPSGDCIKIECGFESLPPPPPVDPNAPDLVINEGDDEFAISATLVGENLVELSWTVSAEVVEIQGLPGGATPPEVTIEKYNSSYEGIAPEGTIQFALNDWANHEFAINSCVIVSDCNHQGCAQPGYPHPLVPNCSLVGVTGVDAGYDLENVPPEVAIAEPTVDSDVQLGQSFVIRAVANDTHAANVPNAANVVSKVEFWVTNSTGTVISLGSDLTASGGYYEKSYTPVEAGSYFIVVVAEDALGARTAAIQAFNVMEGAPTNGAQPSNTQAIRWDRYQVVFGDFNDDQKRDLYLHGLPFTLILHGDVITPIVLPSPPGFAFFGVGNSGEYENVIPWDMDPDDVRDGLANGDYLEVDATDLVFGDIDNDGIDDLLVRSPDQDGSSLVISGAEGESEPQLLFQILATGETLTPSGVKSESPLFADNLSNAYVTLSAGVLQTAGQSVDYATLRGEANNIGADQAKVENINAPSVSGLPAPTLTMAQKIEMDRMSGLSGEFRVNEMGAATYSVALDLPIGTAGVSPPISLDYNSQSGSGNMGLGWSLSVGSTISRCRQTLQVDGVALPIQFASSDRFCLDGTRLLEVSAPIADSVSFTGVTIYKPEIDNGTIVYRHGSASNPTHFTVTRKDGSVSRYGAQSNSSEFGYDASNTPQSAKVMNWHLHEFKDSVGNRIAYHYEPGVDFFRLTQIKYGFGESTSAADVVVDLIYKSKTYSQPYWVKGVKFENDSLLERIEITDRGQSYRDYVIEYNKDVYQRGDDLYDRITSIKTCVNDQCSLPLTGAWGYANPSKALRVFGGAKVEDYSERSIFVASSSNLEGFYGGDGFYYNTHIEMDIDGNGLPDVVSLVSNTDHYRIYSALQILDADGKSTFGEIDYAKVVYNSSGDPQARLGSEAPRMVPTDFNVDGRMDLAVYLPKTDAWSVLISEPQADGNWELVDATILPSGLPDNVQFGDMNADGLADLFYAESGQLNIHYLKRSPGQNASSQAYFFDSTPDDSFTAPSAFDTYNYAGAYDFNEDGKVDIVAASIATTFSESAWVPGNVQTRDYSCDYDLNISVATSSANGFDFENILVASDSIQGQETNIDRNLALCTNEEMRRRLIGPIVMDINGDGISDIAWAFAQPDNPTGSEDDDPDYRIDSIKFRLGEYAPNNGSLTFGNEQSKSVSSGNESPVSFQFLDLNSDRAQDLILNYKKDKKKSAYWVTSNFGGIASLQAEHTDATTIRASRYTDFNADGLLDKVWVLGEDFQVNFGRPRENNLVVEFSSGLGAKTVVQHEPLNLSGSYSRLGGVSSAEDGPKECKEWEPIYGANGVQAYATCVSWGPSWAVNASAFYTAINNPFADEDAASNIHADLNVPALEMISSMPVVTAVGSHSPYDNYPNAAVAVTYEYDELRVQAGGRGMLGFKRLTSTDLQTGVSTATEYRQGWPFIGAPSKTTVTTANGQKLSQSTTINRIHWKNAVSDVAGARAVLSTVGNGTGDLGPLVLYTHQSVEKTFNVPDAQLVMPAEGAPQAPATEQLLSQVTTESEVDDEGNVTELSVVTQNAAEQTIQSQVTSNSYYSGVGERLGRLQQSDVTTTRPGAPGSAVQKTALFTYYGYGGCPVSTSDDDLKGMLCTEAVSVTNVAQSAQPDAVIHYYDSLGNATFTKQGSRVSAFTEYDSKGRFPLATYDLFAAASGESGVSNLAAGYSAAGTVVVKTNEVLHRSVHGVALLTRSYLGDGQSAFQVQAVTPMGLPYFKGDSTGAYEQTSMQRVGQYGPVSYNPSECPSITAFVVIKEKAGGATSTQCNDLLGRGVGTFHPGFDGTPIRTEQRYDILGRAVAVSEPQKGATPTLFTQTEYDILGRPTVVTHPFKRTNSQGVEQANYATTAFTYTGYTTTTVSSGVTDGSDRVKQEVKNALGDLVEVVEQGTRVLGYEYSHLGELIKISDSGTIVAEIDYNDLGQKIGMDDRVKGVWDYHYNAYGDLVRQVDAMGQETTNVYDFKGRKVSSYTTKGSDNTKANISRSWTFDTSRYGLGQLAREQDTSGGFTRQYTFDDKGRASGTVTTLPGKGGSVETFHERQNYDSFGRVKQTFDAARVGPQFGYHGVENVYNAYGYLAKVVNADDAATNDEYYYYEVTAMDARGNVVQMEYGDGNTVTSSYDNATGFLETIERSGPLGSTKTYAATWDHLGNLVKRQDGFLGAAAETFSYDQFNRLVGNTLSGQTTTVTYHQNTDDIQTKSDQQSGAQYNYTSGRLTSIGSRGFDYDSNGNVVADGNKEFEYDVLDKVTKVVNGGSTTTFYNDSQGQRYKRVDTRTVNGQPVTTTTLYIGSVEKIYNNDASVVYKRRIGGVAQIKHTVQAGGSLDGGSLNYFFKDHLGSIVAISNGSGQIVQEMAFDPWGARRQLTSVTSGDWTPAAMTSVLATYAKDQNPLTSLGFTGHEMVDEGGIIHMNGRIYDASIGRFLQADPFVQDPTTSASLNRYAYAWNNPLNAVDPSGYILEFLVASKMDAEVNRPLFEFLGKNPNLATFVQTVGTAVATFYCGPCSIGFNAQFSKNMTYAQTGDFNEAMKSAAITGVSAAAFYAVGQIGIQNPYGQVLAHGAVGGVMAELQGGNFGHGFLSAGITKAATVARFVSGDIYTGSLKAAIVGGTVSVITGGKFANGAITGAFSFALNACISGDPGCGAQKGMSRADFEKEYGDILKAGGIDIDANVKEAEAMSFSEWKKAVATKGKWDYKNSKVLIDAEISRARLDEFGNVHFGIVAGAHGFSLATSLFGAGTYQVFRQPGGSLWDWGNAPFLASNEQARFYTRMGWTWGDNPGDSLNIMKGWDYHDANY